MRYLVCRANTDVLFQFADAEDLQFDPDAFDLLTCCLGLQYVDRSEAISEFFRVLKPGA